MRYLRLPHTRSIGAKRNIAVQGARGEIVVGWDDDDWHGPGRISAQTAPLLAGTADLTGLGTPVFLDTRTGWFWECDDPQWCLFAGQVIGGTLAFPRSWWLTSGGFRHIPRRGRALRGGGAASARPARRDAGGRPVPVRASPGQHLGLRRGRARRPRRARPMAPRATTGLAAGAGPRLLRTAAALRRDRGQFAPGGTTRGRHPGRRSLGGTGGPA
ncbi:glycosyltransferase [Kitasatospora aburaviensis]